MLTADGSSLRIVVDAARRAQVVGVYRVLAIVTGVAGAWGALWFGGVLVAGVAGLDPLALGRGPMLAMGAVGLACIAVVVAVAVWAAGVVRQVHRRFPLGATLLAVGPVGVEGPQGLLPYEALERVAVRWHGVRLAPTLTAGDVAGRAVGRAIGRRTGLDAHRAVLLRTRGDDDAALLVGPFADDAEFGHVIDALRHELGRRGMRLDAAAD